MSSWTHLYAWILLLYISESLSITDESETLNDTGGQYLTKVERTRRQLSSESTQQGNSSDEIYMDVTKYYNITYVSPSNGGADYFVNLNTSDPTIIKPSNLQDAKKVTTTLDIGFPFLFYGNWIQNLTVSTGGFLYMSDYIHNNLASTQYIAPLMAYFDTSVDGNSSEVLLRTDEEMFIVEWRDVYLRRQEQLGKFTFQVQLHREDGKIVAAYKEVPVPIADISWNSLNPLKIGTSDAYYWLEGARRIITKYDTYEAKTERVISNSTIVYTHRQTCSTLDNCYDCLQGIGANLRCNWCSAVNRCSDEFDRQRQEWLTSGCPYNITQTDCDLLFPLPEDPTKLESYKGFSNTSTTTQSTSNVTSSTSDENTTTAATKYINPTVPHKKPVGAELIVTASLGCIAVIVCMVLVAVIVIRRRQKRYRRTSEKPSAAEAPADSEHEYSSADEESTYDSIDSSQMNPEFDEKQTLNKGDITPTSPLLTDGYYYADIPDRSVAIEDPRYISNVTRQLSPGHETPTSKSNSCDIAAIQQDADSSYVLDAVAADYYNTDAIHRTETDDYIEVLA